MSANFFENQRPQSLLKAKIVSKGFKAWATVMKLNKERFPSFVSKIAYIDLYAGRGRYEDGASSTPLLVLEQAIQDSEMSQMLVSIFNDKNTDNSQALSKAINSLEGIDKLKYKPIVYNNEVDESAANYFKGIDLGPTFFFLDPFGYKGLSLSLIKSFMKDWGTDGIFYFGYNSIRRGIAIKSVENHMAALFGTERLLRLRDELQNLDPDACEDLILTELEFALIELGARYVLPFKFKQAKSDRTSHYLIFVSKEFLGYKIMKDIMANEGLSIEGVPQFIYNPNASDNTELYQTSLFQKSPITELENELLTEFSGQSLSVKSLYEKHTYQKKYILRNYRTALINLKRDGKITTNREPKKIGTFAEDIIVTFP